MNINDVATLKEFQGDPLELIFARQKELMEKYEVIEKSNGLLETEDVPVNLHSGRGQARLKNFAWRITEELAEAMDAHNLHDEGWDSPHAREEIADALHFLVEMIILSGVTSDEICEGLITPVEEPQLQLFPTENPADTIATYTGKLGRIFTSRAVVSPPAPFSAMIHLIRDLGMVCHTLKQKPWKQSHMPTDAEEYKKRLIEVFGKFIDLCRAIDMNAAELYDLYFRKSEVNKFRQRSQY